VQSSFRLISTVDRIYFHFLEAETCVARQPGTRRTSGRWPNCTASCGPTSTNSDAW
jgi:hypothetical protein